MPVYHLVFHALGSWMPDHEEGYNDRKTKGRKAQNEKLGEIYRDQLTQPVMKFSTRQRELLFMECRAITARYKWRLHAVAVANTHVHVLLSWKTDQTYEAVQGRMKQHLTYALSREAGVKHGRWFARGGGVIHVRDLDHMSEIMKRYIPNHGELAWADSRFGLDD